MKRGARATGETPVRHFIFLIMIDFSFYYILLYFMEERAYKLLSANKSIFFYFLWLNLITLLFVIQFDSNNRQIESLQAGIPGIEEKHREQQESLTKKKSETLDQISKTESQLTDIDTTYIRSKNQLTAQLKEAQNVLEALKNTPYAQIEHRLEEHRKRVNQSQSKVDELEQKVNSLNDNHSEISALETKKEELEKEILKIEKQMQSENEIHKSQKEAISLSIAQLKNHIEYYHFQGFDIPYLFLMSLMPFAIFVFYGMFIMHFEKFIDFVRKTDKKDQLSEITDSYPWFILYRYEDCTSRFIVYKLEFFKVVSLLSGAIACTYLSYKLLYDSFTFDEYNFFNPYNLIALFFSGVVIYQSYVLIACYGRFRNLISSDANSQ